MNFFFFFNDTPTTEIYTLSLHDALPISRSASNCCAEALAAMVKVVTAQTAMRSEEHTSELQSRVDLVCRLLLEKKKNKNVITDETSVIEENSVRRTSTAPCTPTGSELLI